MTASAAIYLLLPVHNRREITQGFIDCLANQQSSKTTLVVVDDGSSDGTVAMIQERLPDAVILQGDGSWWWAGSLQRGLDWLDQNGIGDGDIVLFMNDDSRFASDFIARGVATLNANPGTLLQATIRCAKNGEVVDQGYIFTPESLTFRPITNGEKPNCLTTNGLFTRWGDLKRVGDFHPRLLPHYLSDYEYTWRAGQQGLALQVAENVELSWNRETTGYRRIEANNSAEFLGKLLSPRYPSNPVHNTAFAFLTCPWPLALSHAWRIWREALDTWVVWRREQGQR